MISVIAELLLWFSLLGLFYIFAGYPLLVAMRAHWFPRSVGKAPYRASVSVLISVYGEVEQLEGKLKSVLRLDGADLIREILIGSDGSPGDVAGVVAQIGDARVRLFEFAERRGKPSVLNDLIKECSGEIVLLTDARQPLNPQALTAILNNFADERVGVVSGELIFVATDGDTTAAKGIGAYWRYEKWIRRSEAAFGSVPGATGAIYAIRRALLEPLPANTLLDDVAIPMRAIQRGFRCVFESRAEAYDHPESDPRKEALRKRRTIAGNVQLIRLWPSLLNPAKNPAWFAFVSHKLLRLLAPFLLLIAWIANVLLLDSPRYLAIGYAHLILLFIAGLGGLFNRVGLRMGLLGAPMMFFALNATTLAALWDAATGRFEVRWAKGEKELGRT